MDSGRKPPYVIAVCGASCSGKTTIASKLAEALNGAGKRTNSKVLVLQQSVAASPSSRVADGLTRRLSSCIDDDAGLPPSPLVRARSAGSRPGEHDIAHMTQALSGDDFFLFDQYGTDMCPTKDVNDRTWKDWESIDSIDWEAFIEAVRKAKEDPNCPTYIVIEGFLLLATVESRKLFDAVVNVKLTKEECWSRRKSRAQKMKHLPPGFSSGEDKRNYEVLPTYVKSDAEESKFVADAAAQFPDEGELDWLRLYFEEVIWPSACKQQQEVESCGLPKLELDACTPSGKEAWQEATFPEAMEFVSALFPGQGQ